MKLHRVKNKFDTNVAKSTRGVKDSTDSTIEWKKKEKK